MSAIETEVKNNSNEISLRGYLERTGNGARKGNGLIIDPSVVVEQEGFNTRTAGMGELYYSMPHVVEHLNSLADAYMEDPFSVTPIVVQMVNGVPVLRQGACRIRSIAIANRQLEAEGRERITRIRCEEFRGSASKAELFTLTGNSNLALSVVAEALSIKRLVEDKEEPKTFAELAKKRGKSEQHLRQMVRVLDLPSELQTMLVSDQVSMYVALDEYMYSGEDAVDNINKAISIYGKATKNTLKFVKAAKVEERMADPQTPENIGAEQPAGDATDNTLVPEQLNDESNTDTLDTPPVQEPAPAPKDSAPKQNPAGKAPSMSSVLNKKTVTVIADTAIPIFERIAEEAKLKEGESVSTDTYTLVLTNDEMNDIINAHADLKEYLRKHAEKMNKGQA